MNDNLFKQSRALQSALVDVLSFLEDAGPSLIHLLDGGGGGEEGVVGGVERGGAAVSLFHRQGAGSVLQSLQRRTHTT